MFRPRRLIPVVAAAALLLLAAAAPAGAHYPNRGAKDCGFIIFTPQSDDGASAIMARNVSCKTARRIVKAINRGNSRPFGFRCKSRVHDFQLAHADVRCKKGSRVVTFART
jgi:hypothetical protein